MFELVRSLRFCPTGDPDAPRDNAHAAWPPPRGLGPVLRLDLAIAGRPDPATGVLLNVKDLDAAFAGHGLPLFRESPTDAPVAGLLRRVAEALAPALPHPLVRLRLSAAPGSSTELHLPPASETAAPAMPRVTIRQPYSFAAAHRLHAPALTEEENVALFGHCHRPSFHGHNYTLEVAASAGVDAHGRSLDPADLDAAVRERVIDALDHRNLNLDVPAFADRNPTVEHIAQTCWSLLHGHLPAGATLEEVTVHETDRTGCTYRGG